MGQYDVPIIVGAGIIVGYFILTNPDLISGLFPQNTDTSTDTDTTGTDADTSTTSVCGQLCKEKMCTTYKSQCTTGCVYCCDSGKNSPKCSGGSGGSFSKGKSGSSECQRKFSGSCNTECAGGCTSLCKDCHKACGGSCSSSSEVTSPAGAGKGGQNIKDTTSCPAHVSGNCGGDCKKTCWHGIVTPGNIKDVCVDQAYSTSACNAARSKFLDAYGGKAFAYSAHRLAFMTAVRNRQDLSIS